MLARVVKPNARMVVRLTSLVGEKDTIVRYPDLIESPVAAGRDPIASAANLAELRAIISALGFRPAMRVSPEDLRQLTEPTLLVWGDHDPIGGVKLAQATASLIPDAQLDAACRTRPLAWQPSPGIRPLVQFRPLGKRRMSFAASRRSYDEPSAVRRRPHEDDQRLGGGLAASPSEGASCSSKAANVCWKARRTPRASRKRSKRPAIPPRGSYSTRSR